MKSETKWALIFFIPYILLFPLLLMALLSENAFDLVILGIGFIWWLLCLPGYIISWALVEWAVRYYKGEN